MVKCENDRKKSDVCEGQMCGALLGVVFVWCCLKGVGGCEYTFSGSIVAASSYFKYFYSQNKMQKGEGSAVEFTGT